MPDNNSALFPQPPQQNQQQNSLLSNPGQAVNLMQGLQNLQIQRATMPAQIQHPYLENQGTELENFRRAQELRAAQSEIVRGQMANRFAGDSKATADDVRSHAVYLSRLNRGFDPEIINSTRDLLLAPGGIQHNARGLLTTTLPPGAAATPVEAPPSPGGARQKEPAVAGIMRGPHAVELAPGESKLLESPVERASALQATASTSPQAHADLENLKQDSKILDNLGGPTAETEKRLNQLSQRVGGFGVTMSADQLRALESFDKISGSISANQAKMLGASTDAGRDMIVGTTPNSSMSRFGREGMIDLMQGNQDFLDKTRQIWLQARKKGATAASYDEFVNNLTNPDDPSKPGLSPRVFQFGRLSRENQQKFLHTLPPEDIDDFETKYKYALDQKWVKPLKKKENAAPQ